MPRPLTSATPAGARLAHALAAACFAVGAALAAQRYPGGFDWAYGVMSALASLKHNPDGGRWFAGGLAAGMALLWGVTRWLRQSLPPQPAARFAVGALDTGLLFGVFTGLERAWFFHLSDVVRKGHELLALTSFVALYVGLMTIAIAGLRRRWYPRAHLAVLLAVLVAIGVLQLWLWLGQRELGWVGRDWRALGIPVWRSFAFWQWGAFGAQLAAFGYLAWVAPRR